MHPWVLPTIPTCISTVSLRAALHTGSWSCFLARHDGQQIAMSSGLILGIIFSLWAPKRPKPKSNRCMHISEENEKKNCTDLLTIARALWQQQTVNRQQSTFFETEFRSPNFCSWPAKQSFTYKTYVKWFIICCSGSKRQDCITLTLISFHSHWLLQELTPILRGNPRGTPGCTMCRKPWGREHLGAMVLSRKCWPGAQRSWGTGHDRKHIKRQIQWQSQSWSGGCAMCNLLKNQEQISVLHGPFHRSFTLFPSLLSTSVLVVSTITLLPLFPWHSTFHPFWFFPFLFNTFLSTSFLSLLILSCFSSFFLLTFLPDS